MLRKCPVHGTRVKNTWKMMTDIFKQLFHRFSRYIGQRKNSFFHRAGVDHAITIVIKIETLCQNTLVI